jgi:hypothetical protein
MVYSTVMRGPDPRIHDHFRRMKYVRKAERFGGASWIAGSSPATTILICTQARLQRSEASSRGLDFRGGGELADLAVLVVDEQE